MASSKCHDRLGPAVALLPESQRLGDRRFFKTASNIMIARYDHAPISPDLGCFHCIPRLVLTFLLRPIHSDLHDIDPCFVRAGATTHRHHRHWKPERSREVDIETHAILSHAQGLHISFTSY
jgi:hypothetical protein